MGQLKGTIGKGKVKGVMIKGDPIFSLTANNHGLMVRFSNRDSTENFHEGLKKHLSWTDSTGQWVHVKIVTTFGESMVVGESGSGNGSDSDRKQGLPEDVVHVRTGNPRHASKQARTVKWIILTPKPRSLSEESVCRLGAFLPNAPIRCS